MVDADWRIRNFFGHLSEDCLSALRLFHVELLRFNQKLNLISTFTEKNADLLHFYDSIKASEFIRKDIGVKNEIFDYGSGNGFPAIVFSVLNPDVKVNMVEVDERKAEFLRHISSRLELKNTKIMQTKAEALSIPEPSVVMCRAFANLARTLLLSNKVLKPASHIYSLKGPDWFSELAALPNQICSTWNTEMAFEYEIPENLGSRVILKSTRIS